LNVLLGLYFLIFISNQAKLVELLKNIFQTGVRFSPSPLHKIKFLKRKLSTKENSSKENLYRVPELITGLKSVLSG